MAYARKTKKTTRRPVKKSSGIRKRTYRRRRDVFRPQRMLRVGFPKTTAVKLRYIDSFSLNPLAATLSTYVFRANSVFDPNLTGVGHQPSNFDMWANLYNHYMVIGSKITATFNLDTTALGGGFVYGINLADDTTFTTDPTTMMEQGLTRYKISDFIIGNGKSPTAKCGFSCKKFFNIANPLDNISRVGASVAANPNDTANFVVFAGPTPSNATDLSNIAVTVLIDFIVIFSEPKELPLS